MNILKRLAARFNLWALEQQYNDQVKVLAWCKEDAADIRVSIRETEREIIHARIALMEANYG